MSDIDYPGIKGVLKYPIVAGKVSVSPWVLSYIFQILQ